MQHLPEFSVVFTIKSIAMKHYTLSGILLPCILILLQACASSRVNSHPNPVSPTAGVPDVFPAAESGNAVYRNDIHIRAVRHFKKTYPGVEDERWYVIRNGFMAKYKIGDVGLRIDYDQYGRWLYSIRYYTEKKLPRDVRGLVKSTWYDYAISSVEEIDINKQLIYIVHIHEGADWKMIRVCDGEVSEILPPGKIR